jgi:hypothetical protein
MRLKILCFKNLPYKWYMVQLDPGAQAYFIKGCGVILKV